MKLFKLIIFVSFFINLSFSQRVLTLDESIKIALKESYSINTANFNVESSRKSLEAVRRGMLSRVDLSLDAPRYTNNLSPEFNPITGITEYYQIKETKVQGNLSITQPLVFSNGTISLIGSLFGSEQNTDLGLNKNYYTNVAIQLRQPLFTANTQMNNIIRSERNLEKTESQYTRTQFDIIYNVTQSFYNLFQSIRQLEISDLNVRQRGDAFNTAQNKFKAGLIPEVEMLQLEVELASGENELLNRRREVDQAKNSFKVLIGLPLDEEIDLIPELNYSPFPIDSVKALNLALRNDVELKNSKIDLELQEYSVDEVKSKGRLRTDILANYGFNKNDKSFKNLSRDLAESRSVSLSFSLPVFDWGANSLEVEAAEATYNNYSLRIRNEELLVRQEIIDLIKRIDLAKSKIRVVTRAMEVAEKSYSISIERYKTGQIKSDEMVNEQKRLINAKNENLSAVIDYKKAIAELTRKTYYDFENNKEIVLKLK